MINKNGEHSDHDRRCNFKATTFVGGSYIAKWLSGSEGEAEKEKIRHDKALEAYQKAMGNYQKRREEYQDWLNKEYSDKKAGDENLDSTDQAFQLYAKAHPQASSLLKKPHFHDFYRPGDNQKRGELIYIGAGMAVVAYAASRLL